MVYKFNITARNESISFFYNFTLFGTVTKFWNILIIIVVILPVVESSSYLVSFFLSKLHIFFFIGTSHLAKIHKQNFIFSGTEFSHFAVLLNHSCFFVLVQNPQSNRNICCIKKISWKNYDCFYKIVFNQLLTDFKFLTFTTQCTVCKKETCNTVLRKF